MKKLTIDYMLGDVFDRMAEMDDGSVDLVLTSPPFLALRSYLPADHPDKAKEIGSEPTPAEFLDTLLHLTAEWGRLVGDGSIAVELGDTYAGSGGAGGDYNDAGLREGQPKFRQEHGEAWPLAKSLCFMPQLYGASLAYGRNLLTGEPSPAGQWRVRNVVRWVRPNPPVGSLGDKYRPATSEMIVATRSQKRWFDLDAVRIAGDDGAGAPPLDWWQIPTAPYKGSHYATWPPALCEVPIKSMCPERVCRTCGEASKRITEPTPEYAAEMGDSLYDEKGGRDTAQVRNKPGDLTHVKRFTTIGWTDCGHDDYRAGVVLDPFAGSGTTLAVATGLGRRAVGIDLDDRNLTLARERCKMTRWVDGDGRVFWTTRRGKNTLLWAGDQAVGGKVADAVWKNPDVKKIAKKFGLAMDAIVTIREA